MKKISIMAVIAIMLVTLVFSVSYSQAPAGIPTPMDAATPAVGTPPATVGTPSAGATPAATAAPPVTGAPTTGVTTEGTTTSSTPVPVIATPVPAATATPLRLFEPTTSTPLTQPVTQDTPSPQSSPVFPTTSTPLTQPTTQATPVIRQFPTAPEANRDIPRVITPQYEAAPAATPLQTAPAAPVATPLQVAPAPLRVFVNNRAMATALPVRGTIYVDATEFLNAGGFRWTVSNGVAYITPGTGGGPAFTSAPSGFSFNNIPFSAHSFISAGRLLIQGRTLANAIGLSERFTADANTYDFFTRGTTPPVRSAAVTPAAPTAPAATPAAPAAPNVPPPPGAPTSPGAPPPPGAPTSPASPTTAAPQTPQAAGQPTKVTFKDDQVSKSVIKPNVQYFYDWKQGFVRGSVQYTNSAKEKIGGISIVFKIADDAGNAMFSQNHNIGELAAGAASKQIEFYYTNPSNLGIYDRSFKYEITYMQPPAPAATTPAKP